MQSTSKHILVIRLSAMGDVAMVVPVLRALEQQYPDIKVTLLTKGFFTPFFRDLKQTTVFNADLKGAHKGVYGLFKLAKQLEKNHRFYAVADLHNVLRSKILKTFLKTKRFVSIDKGRKEKGLLTKGKRFEQLKTTHQRYADVFEALGFPIDLSKPQFPKKVVLNSKLQSLIGESSKKRIGIAPFAAHAGKMYPLELMTQLIERLSNTYEIVLFGGGTAEISKLNRMASQFDYVTNLAGELSLDEELDVISNLDLMLAMDSGNAHMAAMLGIKVVTIWGVTHPFAGFAPFNQPDDYALLPDRNQYPKIPTSVYGNKYPEDYKTVAGTISIETVMEKINAIL